MEDKLLRDNELEKISGGPEERTVLGRAAMADCRQCKNCGRIIEDKKTLFCPDCGRRIPRSDRQ